MTSPETRKAVDARRVLVKSMAASGMSRLDIARAVGATTHSIKKDITYLTRGAQLALPPSRQWMPLPSDLDKVLNLGPREAQVAESLKDASFATHSDRARALKMSRSLFGAHLTSIRQKYEIATGVRLPARPTPKGGEEPKEPPQNFPRCACGCLLPCGGSKRCTPLDEATESAIAAELFAKLRGENNYRADRAVAP